MLFAGLRRFIAAHRMVWCIPALLLAALQPFLAVHFRHDGWEDEPGFRIRDVGTSTYFEPDSRAGHPTERETTLFVSSSAHIDQPDALRHGLDDLIARVLLLLPLTVALLPLARPIQRVLPEPVSNNSGAPPPTKLWRRRPPETAPPLTT